MRTAQQRQCAPLTLPLHRFQTSGGRDLDSLPPINASRLFAVYCFGWWWFHLGWHSSSSAVIVLARITSGSRREGFFVIVIRPHQ
jgi:hypothetical protein